MNRPLALAVLCFTLQAPLAARAQSAAVAPASQTPAKVDAKTYAEASERANLFEIEAGRIAIGNSRNLEIQAFAAMMENDHRTNSRKLGELAETARIALPSAPDAAQQKQLAALRGAKGADFDRLYIELQRAQQRDALELHQAYAANGDDDALKKHAGGSVSVVQRQKRTFDNMVKNDSTTPGKPSVGSQEGLPNPTVTGPAGPAPR